MAFHDYAEAFRRGTFVLRRTIERSLTSAEISRIPVHRRPAPGATFLRSSPEELHMDFLHVSNRADVLLDGAEPVMAERRMEAMPAAEGAMP